MIWAQSVICVQQIDFLGLLWLYLSDQVEENNLLKAELQRRYLELAKYVSRLIFHFSGERTEIYISFGPYWYSGISLEFCWHFHGMRLVFLWPNLWYICVYMVFFSIFHRNQENPCPRHLIYETTRILQPVGLLRYTSWPLVLIQLTGGREKSMLQVLILQVCWLFTSMFIQMERKLLWVIVLKTILRESWLMELSEEL